MAKRIPLNISFLSELLTVDVTSPSGLRWIKKPSPFSPIHVGNLAGSVGSESYYRIKINGTTYLNHRIVWALANNADPGIWQIDHIDGNRTNNDPANLRLATCRINSQNKLNRSRHGIGVKKHYGSYQASIRINGMSITLGTFSTAEEASMAYQEAARNQLPLPAGGGGTMTITIPFWIVALFNYFVVASIAFLTIVGFVVCVWLVVIIKEGGINFWK